MNKMKTIKKLVLAAVLAGMGLCGSLWAAPAAEADFEFESATGTITGYKGAGGDVEIPAQIGGVDVKAIGSQAFFVNPNLMRVTIPASVTTIGDRAFYSCNLLLSVTFAEGSQLKSIGDGVFYYCPLASVTFPVGCPLETIGRYAFKGTYLKSVTIPAKVTNVGADAFRDCKSLANVTFAPDCKLGIIGVAAFAGSGLVSVALPEGLTDIEMSAFDGCGELTEITIPEGVMNIGNRAFAMCSKLEEVVVLATKPPKAEQLLFAGDEQGNPVESLKAIRVPVGSMEDYKKADGWDTYASLITDGSAPMTVPVEYYAWDGKTLVAQTCSVYQVVRDTTATFEDGWYVVEGTVTNTTGGIVVNGSTHLILKDDAELVVTGAQHKAGIDVSVSGSAANSLSIFGQAEGSGRLLATGGMYGAAIGGQHGGDGGSITINGGDILANGGFCACAIGGGAGGEGTQVTINGGNVKAYGNSSSGIGGNKNGRGFGIVTINGGVVYAEGHGKSEGSGIGGGYLSDGTGTINFNGGIVTAYSYGGHAIGNSESGPQSCVKVGFATDRHFAILTGTQSPGGYISAEDFTTTYDQPYVHIEAGKVVFKANQSVGLKMAVSNETGEVSLLVYDGVGYYLADPGDTLKVYLALGPSYLWKSPLESNPVEITMDQTVVALEDYIPQIYQTPVEYLEWDQTLVRLLTKTCEHYTVVTPETSYLLGGWYVVMEDIDHSSFLTVAGTADNPSRLILCDGVTWQRHPDYDRGIMVEKGKVLSIYGQRECTGKLDIPCTSYSPAAVIGGDWNYQNCGTINVNGGTIVASSRSGEAIGKSGEDGDMFGAVNLSEGFLWQVSVGDEGHDEQTVSAEEYMLDHHWKYARLVAKPTTFVTAQPFTVQCNRDNGYWTVVPEDGKSLADDETWVVMGLSESAVGAVYDDTTGKTVDQAFFDEVYGFVAGAEPVVAGSRSIAALEEIVRRFVGVGYYGAGDEFTYDSSDLRAIVLCKCRRAKTGEFMALTIGLVGDLQTMAHGATRPNEISTAVRTTYYAWNDETRRIEGPFFARAMPLIEGTRTLRDGCWYVTPSGVAKFETLSVSGDAHLILEDGCEINLQPRDKEMPGLRLLTPAFYEDPTRSSISIYGQKAGTGFLHAQGDASAAGIGTRAKEYGQTTINIHGGRVEAFGGVNGGAAIGTGVDSRGCFDNQLETPCTLAINVYGGTVLAKVAENSGGAGLGFGYRAFAPHCLITVLGGDVTAYGDIQRHPCQAIGWGGDCTRPWVDPQECDYLKLTIGKGMGLWTAIDKGTGEDADDSRLSAAAYDERISRMDDWRPYAHIKPAPSLSVEVSSPEWNLVSYAITTNGAPMELENNRGDRTFQLPDVTEVEITFTAEDGYTLNGEQTWTRFIGALDFESASAFRVVSPTPKLGKLVSRQHFELVRNGDSSFTLKMGDAPHFVQGEQWYVVTDAAEASTAFNSIRAEAQAAIGRLPVSDVPVRKWIDEIAAAGGSLSGEFRGDPSVTLASTVGNVLIFKVLPGYSDGCVMTVGGAFDLQTMTAGGGEIRTGSLDAECVQPLGCEVKGRFIDEYNERGEPVFDFTLDVKDGTLAEGEGYFWVAYRRLEDSGLDDVSIEGIRRRRSEFLRIAPGLIDKPVGGLEQRLHNFSVYNLFQKSEEEYYAATGRAASLGEFPALLPHDTEEVFVFRTRLGANGEEDAKVVAIGNCAGISYDELRWVNRLAGATVTLPYYAWDAAAGKVVAQPPVEATVLPEPKDGEDIVLHGNCWYAVVGNRDLGAFGLRVDVGTAHLILADGASLLVNGGVMVDRDATLAIYSETETSMDLSTNDSNYMRVSSNKAISRFREPAIVGGSLEIHGGAVNFEGRNDSAIRNRRTVLYGGRLAASSVKAGSIVVSSRVIDLLGGRFEGGAILDGSGDDSWPQCVVAGEQDGRRCELNVGRGAFVTLRHEGIGQSAGNSTIAGELDVNLEDGVYVWSGDGPRYLQRTTVPLYRIRPKECLCFCSSPDYIAEQRFSVTAEYDENVRTNGFTLALPAEELRPGEKWCVLGFDAASARMISDDGGMTVGDLAKFDYAIMIRFDTPIVGDSEFAREYAEDGFEGLRPCFFEVTESATVEIPAAAAVDMVMVARVLDAYDLPVVSMGMATELQSMANGETRDCEFEFVTKQEFSVERDSSGDFKVTMPEGDILKPGESWAWAALPAGIGDDDEFAEMIVMEFGMGMPVGFLSFDMFAAGAASGEVTAFGATTDGSFTVTGEAAAIVVGKTRPGASWEDGPCEYLALTFGMASHLNVPGYKDWPRHDEVFPSDSDYCKVTIPENDKVALFVSVDGTELEYRPDGVYTVRKGSNVRIEVLLADPENYELRSPSVLAYDYIQGDVTVGPQDVVVVAKSEREPVADQGFVVRRDAEGGLAVDMSGEAPLGLGEMWVCMAIDKDTSEFAEMESGDSFGDLAWRSCPQLVGGAMSGELALDSLMIIPGAENLVVTTNSVFAIPSDSELVVVARAYDAYNGKAGSERYYALSIGGARRISELKPGESAEGERWGVPHQVRYSAWDGEKIVHGLMTNAAPLTAECFGADGRFAVTSNSVYSVTGVIDGMDNPVIDVAAGVTLSLIVKDGAVMEIGRIHVPSTATLNIYGQDDCSGVIDISSNRFGGQLVPLVGGEGTDGCGTINVHGGMLAVYDFRSDLTKAAIGSCNAATEANGTLNVYRGDVYVNAENAIGIGGYHPMQVNVRGGSVTVEDGAIFGLGTKQCGIVLGEGYKLLCGDTMHGTTSEMSVGEYEKLMASGLPKKSVRIVRPATLKFDADIAALVAAGKLAVMVMCQSEVQKFAKDGGDAKFEVAWTAEGGTCALECGARAHVIFLANGKESVRRSDVMSFFCVTGDVEVTLADLNWHEPELVSEQKFEAYRCIDGRVRLTPKGKLAEGEAWLWISMPDYIAKESAKGELTIGEMFAQQLKGAVDSKICYVGGVRDAGSGPVVEPMLRPLYNCVQGDIFLPTDGFHWGVSKEKKVFYAPADADFAAVCKVYDAGIAQLMLGGNKDKDKPAVKATKAGALKAKKKKSLIDEEMMMMLGCRYTAETAGAQTNLQKLPRLPEYEPGDERNPWPLGPEDAEEPVAYTNDTNTIVIKGKGPFAEPTKKPWLEEGVGPITEIVIKDPETELPDDIFEGLGTPEPIGVDLPDGWPADDLPVPGQPWHGGYVKIEEGHWPLTISNVKFQQRYPWNGLVDITFDLTGSTNVELGVWAKSGSTTIAASNFVGRTDMMFAVESRKTVKLVWDADKDALPGDLTKLVLENATITVGTDSSAGSGSGGKVFRLDLPNRRTNEASGSFTISPDIPFGLEPGDEIVVETQYMPPVNIDADCYLALCAFDAKTPQLIGAIPEPCLAAYKAENGDFAAGEGEFRFTVTEDAVEAFKRGWLNLCWGNVLLRATTPDESTDRIAVTGISIVRAGGGGVGAESAAGLIDLAKGTRVARAIENIVIDPKWGEAATASVLWPKTETPRTYDAATVEQWNTARLPAGQYEFTYKAGSTDYTAAFWLAADNWTVIDHETIEGERPVTGEKVLVAGESVIKQGGKLVIAGEPEIIWDGAFKVEKGGRIYAPHFDVVVDPATGLVTLVPKDRPTVTGLRFAQRYPWNGLVDVFFTATYAKDPAAKVWVKLAAKLDGEEKPVKTLYLANDAAHTNTQFQVTQGEVHLIWDTMKDVGIENYGRLEITAQAALARMAEEEEEPREEDNLLCLTARGGVVLVNLHSALLGTEFGFSPDLEYSKDGVTWTKYIAGKTRPIQLDADESIYFRGINPDGWNPPDLEERAHKYDDVMKGLDAAMIFQLKAMTENATVEASGSVMSLIDGKGVATEIPCEYCFCRLFYQCPALTKAPDLTATTLKVNCYMEMFSGNQRIDRIKMLGIGDERLIGNVLSGVISGIGNDDGTFVLNSYWENKQIPFLFYNWRYEYEGSETPVGDSPEPLCFTPMKGSGSILVVNGGENKLYVEYSIDGVKWIPFDPLKPMEIKCGDGQSIYLRGKNPNGLTTEPKVGYFNISTRAPFEVSGDVMSLIDYEKKVTEIPCNYCFYRLFEKAEEIYSAPKLSATVLKPNCYEEMFMNTHLAAGPELLAEYVPDYAYAGMFEGCSDLSQVRFGGTKAEKFSFDGWLDGAMPRGTIQAVSVISAKIIEEYGALPEGWGLTRPSQPKSEEK